MLKRLYILTCFGEGAALVPHLDDVEIVIGQIQDLKDTVTSKEKFKPEDPEEKKRRLTVGDGFCKKVSAEELVKKVNADPNPEEAFVFTDLNICWKFAEQMKDSGVPGIYPTEADRLLEVDREGMKEMFNKHYPDLKVGQVEEFKKVDDALKFLDGTEDVWVLKGDDIDAKTVVPDTDQPDLARGQIETALEAGKDKYEKSGFILEKKIKDVKELTPQLTFFDGKPISANIDIELKRQGAGDVGPMCGCAADLVFPISLDSPILKMAFPKYVYDMAKKHGGLFIFDCSLLFDPRTGDAFAGEVCSNRPGWNSVLTEMSLSGGAQHWLEALQEGKDPFDGVSGFASSVRVFNPNKEDHGAMPDMSIDYEESVNIFLMDGKDEECCTAGYGTDLAIVTGVGSTIKSAAHKAYTNLMDFNFEGKIYRPEEDYMSEKYKSSIINRYKYGKSKGLFYL